MVQWNGSPQRAPVPADEATYVRRLVERVVAEFPRRQAGSADERGATELVAREFAALGFPGKIEPFEWNTNLYALLALHFGIGTLGTAVSGVAPLAGLGLHLLAGTSYRWDSTRRRFLLRRLLKQRTSQNLIVTLPAVEEPALRLVYMAHIDAAPTGYIFEPEVVRRSNAERLPPALSFLGRPLRLATGTQFALAGFDALRILLGPLTWPLRPIEWALSVPALIAFLTNLQIVLKNEIVPGANDDLSGVAGMMILAQRLALTQPDDVELVFVVSGAEEAGLGGATRLAQQMRRGWDPDRTVILGMDTLAGGEVVWLGEGEIVPRPVAGWLLRALEATAARDERFHHVREFAIPAGATDVLPFLVAGYDGVCIGRVDRQLGAPHNYHLPSDTPENLDVDQVVETVDFVEQLTAEVIRRRVDSP